MEILSKIVQPVLDLGPAIFVPLIIITIGLLMKMKFKDAFVAGLTLGVAFVGMSTLIDFMMGAITPAAQGLVEITGLNLNAIDVGWSPLSSIAWGWPFAFMLFPLQITINLVMLWRGWTNCLNVDLWNVWNKILTSVLVIGVVGNNTIGLPLAFAIASIEIIIELKNADLTQKQIQKLTGIPGIACPHSMNILGVILLPIDNLLKKIKFFQKEVDADSLKEKIGIFAENHVVGFIIGIGIGLIARYDIGDALNLGVQCATALLLFPMVAKLFMQALSPLSDAAGEFMKKKFPDREFFIGLDWPFMAGRAELWVTAILLVPVILGMAFLMASFNLNQVIPMGGIIAICTVVPALVITGGNVLRMFTLGVIVTPIYLFIGTQFAQTITNLGLELGTLDIAAGQLITWSNMEAPVFRYVFTQFADVVNGNFIGVGLVAVWAVLWAYYSKNMKAREKEVAKELEM